MLLPPPACYKCKHLHEGRLQNPKDGRARRWCKAFPDGIPKDIFFEGVDHTTPYDGDGGVQFKKK